MGTNIPTMTKKRPPGRRPGSANRDNYKTPMFLKTEFLKIRISPELKHEIKKASGNNVSEFTIKSLIESLRTGTYNYFPDNSYLDKMY